MGGEDATHATMTRNERHEVRTYRVSIHLVSWLSLPRADRVVGGEMSSTPAGRVREAAGTLTTPGRLDLRAVTACAQELDTALRASGADGDAAAAEFCSGPPGEPARSALRWCAGVLHRGVPEGANPTDVKGATFVVGVALQVLVSASGADWREQFGHVTRSGANPASFLASWIASPPASVSLDTTSARMSATVAASGGPSSSGPHFTASGAVGGRVLATKPAAAAARASYGSMRSLWRLFRSKTSPVTPTYTVGASRERVTAEAVARSSL